MGAAAALVVAAALALRPGESAQPWRETLYVFGTLVEIEIRGTSPERARVAGEAVARQLDVWHHDWHAWKPGELDDLNAAIASGQAGRVDNTLLSVLDEGARLSCLSDGMFEPAIGNLITLWGFHQDTVPSGARPTRAAIHTLEKAAPNLNDLHVVNGAILSENPVVSLDLGGYAKGVALDLAGEMLAASGIENAVLNAGGDVNVLGHHDDRPWRVAIRDPFVWGAVAAINLAGGEVLYTSGNYERYFDHDGQRYAHIIDPNSGWPVQDVVSVSVLAQNGALADAAATALSVAGDDWPRIAGRMGADAVLVIKGDGTMEATTAMAERLDWPDDAPTTLRLIDPILPAAAPDCPGLRRDS